MLSGALASGRVFHGKQASGETKSDSKPLMKWKSNYNRKPCLEKGNCWIKPERTTGGHLREEQSRSGAMHAGQQGREGPWPFRFLVTQTGSLDVEHNISSAVCLGVGVLPGEQESCLSAALCCRKKGSNCPLCLCTKHQFILPGIFAVFG